MEKLEHFTLDDIWSDFTKATQMDEAIATAEVKINDLIKGNEKTRKGRFGIQGKYYELNYVPASTSKECASPSEFYEDKTVEDIIVSLFGIKTAYFFVTSKNIIDSQEARTVLSILTSAANGCKVKIPFFVLIQKKEYMTFVGFSHEGTLHTHMSSYTDWKNDTPFTGFGKTKELFINSFRENDKSKIVLVTNQRKHLQIERDDFNKSAYFKESTFCSRIKQDPIQSLKFIVQTKPNSEQHEKMAIEKADSIAIIIKLAKRRTEETRLSEFIDFFYQTQQFYEFKRSNYDSQSMQVIETIWEKANQPGEKSILKAAPKDSLLCDLVISMTAAESFIAACSMWTMFLKKIRSSFDNNEIIPGIETTGPDFDNCIIYQKLQMINFCIAQHDVKKREFTESKETGKLLLNGKPMISPSTQAVTAKTEDQFIESTELLTKNYDDQVQKSKLQSKQLESDISAFKAENEGCCFEDFVRWYSPSDFNEETKSLSARMSEEGNIWHSLYDKCKPIKAIDQIPLFDASMEAELALDYLESMITGEVFGDLIEIIIAAAYFNIESSLETRVHSNEKYLAEVKRAVKEFHDEIDLATNNLSALDYVEISKQKAQIIEKAVSDASVVKSLLKKFPDCFDMVQNLNDNSIAFVSNEEEMKTVQSLMESLKINQKRYRQSSSYIISGTTENVNQRIQVSRYFDKLGLPNRVVIASSIQEKK